MPRQEFKDWELRSSFLLQLTTEVGVPTALHWYEVESTEAGVVVLVVMFLPGLLCSWALEWIGFIVSYVDVADI